MAEKFSNGPQSISEPVGINEIESNSQEQTPRLSKAAAPTSIDKPIHIDEVSKGHQEALDAEAAQKIAPKHTQGIGAEALYSRNNTMLADRQFTNQGPEKETFVANARNKDDDGNEIPWEYHDKDTNSYKPIDKDKHHLFQNTETGQPEVHVRDRDKDRGYLSGVMTGLGHFVSEGFVPSPGVGAATSSASWLSKGGKKASLEVPAFRNESAGRTAVEAADTVHDTTGATVPVPQSAVTTHPAANLTTNVITALPSGSKPYVKAASAMGEGLVDARDQAAGLNTAGRVSSTESAGEAATEGITNYAKPARQGGVLGQRVADAYDKVDNTISGGPHQLNNTVKAAQDIQTAYESTKMEGFAPAIKDVLAAATDPKGLTYDGLKRLRSHIGEMIETGAKIAETGIQEADLKRLYKGLTDDMRDLVTTQGGPRGLQLWERANTYARLASERREQLAKVLGTNRSEEGVVGAILRKARAATGSADARSLEVARKSMPADAWNEVVSSVVSSLGTRVTKGEGKIFDPGQFVKDFESLSPRGKSILFGDNQRLRKALDSISSLGKTWDTAASTAHEAGPLSHLISTAAVVNHEGGLVSKTLHVIGGIITMRGLGNMLSKPATAESVAKWMEGYKLVTLKPTRSNVMLFNKATNAFANDAAKDDRERIGDAGAKAIDYAKKLTSLVSPFAGK